MIPIVYKWTDVGAPVSNGTKTSMISILHACLVTGYGSKAAAGWTRPYVNATFDKACFRNNQTTGTGFYLQVNALDNPDASAAYVQGYESMTSESDGLFPFNDNVQTIATSNVVGSTSKAWILIADDRAFYFIGWNERTVDPVASDITYVSSMFFGDLVSRWPGDGFACGLQSGRNEGSYGLTQPTNTNPYENSLGVSSMAVPRLHDGTSAKTRSVMIRGGGPGVNSGAGGSAGLSYTPGDQILYTRPHMTEHTAYTFRGWLPGYYYPCHAYAFDQWATVTVDGKSFMSFRHITGGQNGNYFIDLGDWRV